MFVTLLPHFATTEQRDSGMNSLKGISALPMELLRTYDIYLLAPHDESLDPNGDHNLSSAKVRQQLQLQPRLFG